MGVFTDVQLDEGARRSFVEPSSIRHLDNCRAVGNDTGMSDTAAACGAPSRLADVAVSPIIAVTDLDRAQTFYEGALGLKGERVPAGGWVVHAGHGTLITLLEGIPSAGSADWPVATFRVDDIHATVRASAPPTSRLWARTMFRSILTSTASRPATTGSK